MDKESHEIEDFSVKEYKQRLDKYMATNRYYCKCGHSVVISPINNKKLCTHCGIWIFKNKKDEFIYRMKERLK